MNETMAASSSTAAAAVVPGYLGIDIGTQGLSILFTDTNLKVLATGEGSYGFSKEENGCYEQLTSYWQDALQQSMNQVKEKIPTLKILAIGISGQMHGEVLMKENDSSEDGHSFAPCRLWCDARNAEEGDELTNTLKVKVPKRATCARFLWTTRNKPDIASQTKHLTTPAGWMAYRLTGKCTLGIGDAAGMFPVDPATQNYDTKLLEIYNQLLAKEHEKNNAHSIPTNLEDLLPTICKAGEDAGNLTADGAAFLGLEMDDNDACILVAAGEGDQVAALAGSLIGKSGTVSCSFGTSVCANLIGDKGLPQVSPAVDHFCAANGKPIHMVWLRNGTTFLNTMIQSYGSVLNLDENEKDDANAFEKIMPALVDAAPDCGGLVALPFMDDEPGLGVLQGGSAMILGWTASNATPGNVAKAALLSTIFNLKSGCAVVQAAGNEMKEIVLSGGLTKTPACGQIVADIFNLPVRLLEASDEGCSWGACVLAKYRFYCMTNNNDDENSDDWPTFLTDLAEKRPHEKAFQPDAEAVATYSKMYRKYQKLMALEPQLRNVVCSD